MKQAGAARLFGASVIGVVGVLASLAQAAGVQAQPGPGGTVWMVAESGLWGLFRQSFDIFTVLLIGGSVIALAVVISCLIDIRESRILPRDSCNRILDLAASRRWQDLREFVARDESFVARVMRTTLATSGGRDAARESAELAAAEESSRWFRRIELLNVIGNLGPLVGLAGTVWGMILAFTSLGDSGGQAGPSDLSLGISKALFHTLLGLCLAIPCLFVFGLYRSIVDRICTRGTVLCGRVVEQLPDQGDPPRA
ncbi:MAG: MotA/TolQ/ExbB proton channel family protein [Phycisphaeraceae bacterium]|nr:MotA/TolQ/ExbB proton channel family protein [Phycisphaerae bacterium]MBX3393393.1 MotA/TolQ/ExbB proton channel family protein [Phycisphaeraceae bacterium]